MDTSPQCGCLADHLLTLISLPSANRILTLSIGAPATSLCSHGQVANACVSVIAGDAFPKGLKYS